jgi:hypothetical protein
MSYDMSTCPGIFYCDEGQTIMKKFERKKETIGVQVDSELWKQVRIKAIKEKRTSILIYKLLIPVNIII